MQLELRELPALPVQREIPALPARRALPVQRELQGPQALLARLARCPHLLTVVFLLATVQTLPRP
ncbi:MAG: hypothetical protein Q7S64_01815 [bacterium]|nr:hypothetical protein [bacterium]